MITTQEQAKINKRVKGEEEGICFAFGVVFAEDSRPDVVLSKAKEEVQKNPVQVKDKLKSDQHSELVPANLSVLVQSACIV